MCERANVTSAVKWFGELEWKRTYYISIIQTYYNLKHISKCQVPAGAMCITAIWNTYMNTVMRC